MEEDTADIAIKRKSVKKGSIMKERHSRGKNNNSIKFTIENEQISEE